MGRRVGFLGRFARCGGGPRRPCRRLGDAGVDRQDDNLLLYSGPGTRDAALSDLASLGADTVRALVIWSRVAPSARSTHKPAGFDGSTRRPTAPPGIATTAW